MIGKDQAIRKSIDMNTYPWTGRTWFVSMRCSCFRVLWSHCYPNRIRFKANRGNKEKQICRLVQILAVEIHKPRNRATTAKTKYT